MPFLVPFIPALVAGGVAAAGAVGAAAYSANAATNANDKALAAQSAASQQSLAAQQAALERITTLEQPFINAGSTALSPLAARVAQGAPNFSAPSYALPQPGGSGTPGPVGSTIGQATGHPAPPPPNGAPSSGYGDDYGPGTNATVDPSYTGATGFGGPTASDAPASTAGGPDWDAYIAANPDVAAWIQQGHGDPNLGPNQTPEQAAAYQYGNTGRSEGRSLPTTVATPANPSGSQTPSRPLDLGTASPVVANYTRPDQPNAPSFGPAPDQSSFFDASKFATSPGYQFRLDQGMRNTNASFGARGLLQSGAALQGFSDYVQDSASAEYQNWFNQQRQKYLDASNQYNADRNSGLQQFNLDRNNLNQNYADDRSYGTNLAINNRDFANAQYNTGTNNLFQLAALGANGANAVAGATTNNANASANIFTNQGNNAANAAQANGSAASQFGGAVAGAATNIFNSVPRSTSIPLQTSYGSGLIPGSGTAPNGGNATFVNPLPTYSYGAI